MVTLIRVNLSAHGDLKLLVPFAAVPLPAPK